MSYCVICVDVKFISTRRFQASISHTPFLFILPRSSFPTYLELNVSSRYFISTSLANIRPNRPEAAVLVEYNRRRAVR